MVERLLEGVLLLSPIELTVCAGVLLVASTIRGLTGFGFSAILVTGLTFVLKPAEVVVLALLLEIAASAHLLPSVRRSIDWPLLAALAVGIGIGTPIGVWLLVWLDPDLMRMVISTLVLVFALLILKGYVYRGPRTSSVHGGLGLVSGVCNGTAALGGLPLVTFLLSTEASVATTRATLIAAFFATDIYALIFAGGHGIVEPGIVGYALCAIPLLILGLSGGKALFAIADAKLFKKLSLVLLLCLSLAGLLKAVGTRIVGAG